jgi:hypothetical protein
MKYAISSSTDFYHWVTKSKAKMLCGLNVVPIIINRPASSSLYLTEIVEGQQLCERCAASKAEAADEASRISLQ